MILTLKRRRRSPGRHRLASVVTKTHQGWENREHELALLAGHDIATTMPINGLPPDGLMQDCPLDQCSWPDGIYAIDGQDHHARLLEHVHQHEGQDILNTCHRLKGSITKLQERA